MCGICGKFFYSTDKRVNEKTIYDICQSLYRRGPDDEIIKVYRNVGLGMRRLSIVDGERQLCLRNEDATIFLVFNGEIYNSKDFINTLISKGHKFNFNNDVECIIHLYEEFGLDFISKLNGMFSLALFDSSLNRLILVRDRIGIKPLYYSEINGGIVFSSTLKSLLLNNEISKELDIRACNHYFSYNYFPLEYTPISSIRKLLPGHFLVCDNNGLKIEKFWEFRYKNKDSKKKTLDDYSNEFKVLFNEVMATQINADHSPGIFLSGGLDSSTIAYFLSKQGKNIKSFSLGFAEESFDEREYSRNIANRFQFDYYEMVVNENLNKLVDDFSESLDIPVGEPSFINMLSISAFSAKHVKTVFSGDGADELFGGYSQYFADSMMHNFNLVPSFLKKMIVDRIINNSSLSYSWMNRKSKFEAVLNALERKETIPHYIFRENFSIDDKSDLYSNVFYSQMKQKNHLNDPYLVFKKKYSEANTNNYLEQAMYFDTTICLPDGMLQRVDMASMYHSLEVRVPFLDNRIINFAQSLPLSLKIRNLKGKCILKNVMSDSLSKHMINRRKHGFSVPIGKWLKDELAIFAKDIVNSKNLRGYDLLNKQYVVNLLDVHLKGKVDNGRKLWNILVFLLWLDNI
ncbi:MAG: asparagine synthase (glutamine-hydrolyzing) [Candidatus Omnitrophica bacterium]|nr:asparagine synthase (glutamine-hydrolyzing) [Candidatus Omnitrophota bacterium]